MSRLRVLMVISALSVLVGVGGIAFFLGERYALVNLTVQATTPDQLATAMENDHFWSDNDEKTLLVRGLMASVSSDGTGAVLQFQTSGAFTARCEFDRFPATVHPGDTVTVVTEGAIAERQASAVLLRGCSLIGG